MGSYFFAPYTGALSWLSFDFIFVHLNPSKQPVKPQKCSRKSFSSWKRAFPAYFGITRWTPAKPARHAGRALLCTGDVSSNKIYYTSLNKSDDVISSKWILNRIADELKELVELLANIPLIDIKKPTLNAHNSIKKKIWILHWRRRMFRISLISNKQINKQILISVSNVFSLNRTYVSRFCFQFVQGGRERGFQTLQEVIDCLVDRGCLADFHFACWMFFFVFRTTPNKL